MAWISKGFVQAAPAPQAEGRTPDSTDRYAAVAIAADLSTVDFTARGLVLWRARGLRLRPGELHCSASPVSGRVSLGRWRAAAVVRTAATLSHRPRSHSLKDVSVGMRPRKLDELDIPFSGRDATRPPR